MHDRSNVRLTMVQLPALNTPQFTWSVARLPKSPQPVPPIYQPEVAAQAIYWAAHHHRREITVGTPAVRAIIGNKIVPGLADRQLARSAFGSQQTGQPLDPGRPTNLWDPVPGDHGAHGPFSDLARRRSLQLWANERRGVLAGAAAGGIAALAAAAALVRLRER